MTDPVIPGDADEALAAVGAAVAEQTPLELRGAGTKRGWGRPMAPGRVLDLSRLATIRLYEPRELVLTAGPGVRLADLEPILAAEGQFLAFEPPDLGPLYGLPAGGGTLGGALATNLSGPRRLTAGAARDHFLGAAAISGRAEAFKCGGRVVKNVTGYDLPKLLAGSFGTLAVLTEVSVKVLPAPERVLTLVLSGLGDGAGLRALTAALHSPHEISGAAHLPGPVARRSGIATIARIGSSVTLVRVEGFGASVAARALGLRGIWAEFGAVEQVEDADSRALWREIGNATVFVGYPERFLWRLSVPPAAGADVVAKAKQSLDAEVFYDWGGGLIWLAVAAGSVRAGADPVRSALGATGGHATLIRAPDAVGAAVPVFQPEPSGLAALSARVRNGFDPLRLFNRGRLVAEP